MLSNLRRCRYRVAVQASVKSESGTDTANTFQVGRTPEQIFLYFFSGSFGADIVMGSSLSNGTFVGYAYPIFIKETRSYFYYNYTLDSNNNVSTITQFVPLDTPNFELLQQYKYMPLLMSSIDFAMAGYKNFYFLHVIQLPFLRDLFGCSWRQSRRRYSKIRRNTIACLS